MLYSQTFNGRVLELGSIGGEEIMVYERIAGYLREENIKQRRIVERTYLSPQAVSKILSGKQRMYVEDFLAMCNALSVNPCSFLLGEEDERCESTQKGFLNAAN